VTWIVLAASAAIAAVAAAGILRPYGRRGGAPVEVTADPLEDQRSALLRDLRELEDERSSGAISEHDHSMLRAETEARAVAVQRALEARDGIAEPVAAAAVAGDDPQAPAGVRRRSRGSLAALIAGGVLAVALVPILIASVTGRNAGGAITGDTGIQGTASTAPTGPRDAELAALERAVRERPGDVTARLDLAERYLRDGQTGLAALAFTEVLRRDPGSADAHTGLALILLSAGRLEDALSQADQALDTAPGDPDALYARGVVLLHMRRTTEAEQALRAYLRAAPYGAHRDEVQGLLAGASPPGGATPGQPSPSTSFAPSTSP
jgi:cytochrome c-type biogenesis protein CcmH/NrfG